MPVRCSILAAALLSAAASASAVAPAVTAKSAGYSIGVHGFVPVVCRASVDAAVAPADGASVSLGNLTEFCNSPGGYEVYVDHSPELGGASLSVSGEPVALSEKGTTLVSRSSHAAITSRALALTVPDGAVTGTLSFRIVPL